VSATATATATATVKAIATAICDGDSDCDRGSRGNVICSIVHDWSIAYHLMSMY
jgi:hypothetical protein